MDDFILVKGDGLHREHVDPAGNPFDQTTRDQGLVVPVRHMVQKVLIGIAGPGLGASFVQENVLVAPLSDHTDLSSGLCNHNIHH